MKYLLVLLAGCVGFENNGTDWQDFSTITGTLATEVGPDPAPRDPSCTLRVATFNVHFGDDIPYLASQIQASALATADVIFIQEIRRFPDTEPESRAQHLAELLGTTWLYAPAHTVDGNGVHGLAIMSRYPLRSPRIRQLPYLNQINEEQRIAITAEMLVGDQTIPIVDVHLDTRLAPADRIYQLDPAIHDVGDRMVIGGDFNTLPWTWVESGVPVMASEAVLEKQAEVLDDFMGQNSFAQAVSADVVTSRSPVFDIRLDNVYARQISIASGAVEHVDGSDHWPVYADISICD
ncbi:MAG: endonuclease/exonuclease/phosphatase family protein [Kofleriaceae bacterium]